MTVTPDPDLMAAQPEQMLAAAAAYETAAHVVNSVGTATGRASGALLAEWKGRGADSFATRMNHLGTATPDQAQRLAAVATALRTLAPKIAQAQALLRQATTLRDQATTTLDAIHHSNLAAIRAQAAADDATSADNLTATANSMAEQAWQAASAAFDAITATSPTVKTATLTSAIKTTEPAHQPHDRRPKVSPDQVKLITQPDGQRVYSFDGGLKIPADLPGAHHLVEEIKAYMPRFLAGHHGGLEVPAGMSAKHLWYTAASFYILTNQGEDPRQLREQFSIATSSSITFKESAGMSMFGMAGAITPGGASDENNTVIGKLIKKTNQSLGTDDQVAQDIANGHAYDKHVVEEGEYPEISSRAQFRRLIQETIDNPTAEKQLSDGRYAYWNSQERTLVITNPKDPDSGTAFRPTRGYRYYQGLK